MLPVAPKSKTAPLSDATVDAAATTTLRARRGSSHGVTGQPFTLQPRRALPFQTVPADVGRIAFLGSTTLLRTTGVTLHPATRVVILLRCCSECFVNVYNRIREAYVKVRSSSEG